MSDVVVGQQVVVTRGSHVAISASDFTVPQGKITAIIGPQRKWEVNPAARNRRTPSPSLVGNSPY